MKAFALAALLLLSIAFLGCVQPEPGPGPPAGAETAPDSFESEQAALNALEREIENTEDLDLQEIEQALQQ